ncbi:hypothetical protein [Pedobacter sp. Hv1]|nr:hypothetical protein [Pedobacter sp. Hv1]
MNTLVAVPLSIKPDCSEHEAIGEVKRKAGLLMPIDTAIRLLIYL